MRRDGNSANIVHLIFYLIAGQGTKSLHEPPPSLQLLFDPQVSFTIGLTTVECNYVNPGTHA